MVLNLEKNGISGVGASILAGALAGNKCLREVNLMNQTSGRWTDRCLDDVLEMFERNVTLLKVCMCVCMCVWKGLCVCKYVCMYVHSAEMDR